MPKKSTAVKVETPVVEAPKPFASEALNEIAADAVKPAKKKGKKAEPVVEVKADPTEVTNELKSWLDYAEAEGKATREARKYFSRRRQVGFCSPGSIVQNGKTTAEVLEQFAGSSTKVKVNGKAETWAPGTEVELVPADEVKATSGIEVTSVVVGEAKLTEKGKEMVVKAAPKASNGNLYGVSATAILRWMGANDWSQDDALKALAAKGASVSPSTANIQMRAGKKGGDCGGRGPIPDLSKDAVAELKKLAGK